jgi:cytochrome c553
MRAVIVAIILLSAGHAAAVPLEERLPACLACHGQKGTSETPEIPSLGAQMSPFVLVQLYLFREKQRVNEIMNQMAQDLTDADLQTFADAIAKLSAPVPASGPADAAKMGQGQALVQKYRCNFCHAPNLEGRDNVPRIASQREDFLVKTMKEYKTNTRHGYDGSMAEVLQPISEAEIAGLAYYIARQP